MILGIGTDIVDTRRISKSINQFSNKFIDRIFTTAERAAAGCAADADERGAHVQLAAAMGR